MIYLTLFFALILLSIIDLYGHKKQKNFCFIIAALFLGGLICFRHSSVGIDTSSYIGYFLDKGGTYGTINHPGEEIERGFVFFSRLIKWIGFNTDLQSYYLLATGCVTIIPLLVFVKKISYYPVLSLLLIFTVLQGAILVVYLAALRQAMSITFTLAAVYFIAEKPKNYKRWFVVFAACACSCHNTAFLTTFLIILFELIKFKKRYIYIATGVVFVISLFAEQYGSDLFFLVISNINDLSESRYSYYEGLDSYSIYTRTIFSAGLNLFFPVIVTLFKEEENINENIYIKFFIFAPCLFLIFGSFEQISRLVSVFWIIGAVGSFKEQTRNKKVLILFVFGLLFMTSRAITAEQQGRFDGIEPYYFFWER